MEKLQELVDFVKSIEIKQIVNLIIAIIVVIIFFVISSIISYGIVKIFYRKEDKETIKAGKLFKTIKNFLNISGIFISSKILNLSSEQDAFCNKCFKIVVIWYVARIIVGVFDARVILLEKLNKNLESRKSAFMTSVVSKIVQIVLYIIAGYLTLKEFGLDIAGLATGLGLTGAVVALAAQDIVKQIFSGLMIFVDKPFEIGDWVEVEEAEGTVEDITIKSTKIRTIEDTIITIPNDKMTTSNVINWGKISKRVYKTNLKLALETEEVVVEKLLNRIRFILRYNEDIIKKTMYIQFNKIEKDAINIYIYLETTITSYRDYLAFCNKINLTILNILETQGVKLAYPGENIYIKENEANTKVKKIENNKARDIAKGYSNNKVK